MMTRGLTIAGVTLALALGVPLAAHAQTGTPTRPVGVQGFVQVARTSFAAADSLDAVFGDAAGTFVGGGGRVLLQRGPLRGLFFEGSVDRFRKTGERVFVFDGEVFRLGIPATLTLTPILATAGYQFGPLLGRVSPYGGAGAGSYSVRESSDFATAEENVSFRQIGYHAVGGVNVGLSRFIGVGGEVRWTSVRARDLGGVFEEFGDDDLGGTGVGVRLLVGF